MPTAPLLLLPLKRLLSLIPSVLGLFPVLLGPPPMAARLSPLALPPFVPRLPTFALRPLAFLPTPPSNHPRRHPGVRSRDPAAPNNPGPPSHPDLQTIPSSPYPRFPRPQTPPKSTPRSLKSFLEKTLTARETPTFRPARHGAVWPPAAHQTSPIQPAGRPSARRRWHSLPQPLRRIRGCTSATDTQTRGIAIPGPGRITVTTGARWPPV